MESKTEQGRGERTRGYQEGLGERMRKVNGGEVGRDREHGRGYARGQGMWGRYGRGQGTDREDMEEDRERGREKRKGQGTGKRIQKRTRNGGEDK